MKTDPAAIERAGQVIRAGGLVAFPTETVYGLGADATNADAVAKIFAAKGRALNDPLIVHCAPPEIGAFSGDVFARFGNMAPVILRALQHGGIIGALTNAQRRRANALMGSFWPGPLTLVLPRGERIPPNVTAGLDTVAVRIPAHAAALALIQHSGAPIAAPSANRFGHVSPTLAQHVLDDLEGRIDVVLDGGPTAIGVESTVLDLTTAEPVLLRPGGLAREAIESVVGFLQSPAQPTEAQSTGAGMAAPGMLTRHYAPRAQLLVVAARDELARRFADFTARGLHPGVLATAAQAADGVDLAPQFILGEDLSSVARNLYAGLRALDHDGVDVILICAVDPTGIGEAVADRLRRATRRG